MRFAAVLLVVATILPTGVEAKPLCPVAAPVEFINSWGYPRSEGRSHVGTDLFAVEGAPVVAPEAGVVTYGTTRLGGRSAWVQGDSGNRYYLTHLADWADYVPDGERVEPGWTVGYLGKTGNAYASQLHVEVKVRGYNVNPYSWLADSCRTPNVLLPRFPSLVPPI